MDGWTDEWTEERVEKERVKVGSMGGLTVERERGVRSERERDMIERREDTDKMTNQQG